MPQFRRRLEDRVRRRDDRSADGDLSTDGLSTSVLLRAARNQSTSSTRHGISLQLLLRASNDVSASLQQALGAEPPDLLLHVCISSVSARRGASPCRYRDAHCGHGVGEGYLQRKGLGRQQSENCRLLREWIREAVLRELVAVSMRHRYLRGKRGGFL